MPPQPDKEFRTPVFELVAPVLVIALALLVAVIVR
jgi:hypothetical protein